MRRVKIAIFHPQLIAGGGSEAVATLIADVLKKEHDVSLIAMGKINLGELNKFYGTDLKENEINLISIPIPIFLKKRFDALRAYKLARFCRKSADNFDIMISTYNLMDFGKKGIQFIADFSFSEDFKRTSDPAPARSKKWFYRGSFLRNCYLKLAEFLSGDQKNNFKKNMTVANSKWTAKLIEKNYGIDAQVVYPPAVGTAKNIPWDERENGFVCLGRISPEKQIEKIIAILKELRKKNTDLHLHIIGGSDDQDYFRIIKNLCAGNNNWCFLEGKMYGQEKLDFIAKHKFGISARTNEPFGIAVAEMAKAGCVVFVPDGGGQTEIVDSKDLIYKDVGDAVEKINAVFESVETQNNLQQHLSALSQKFSEENFKKTINDLINNFLKNYEKR